eukprot:803316-Rhodomonas_salina.2
MSGAFGKSWIMSDCYYVRVCGRRSDSMMFKVWPASEIRFNGELVSLGTREPGKLRGSGGALDPNLKRSDPLFESHGNSYYY